MNKIITLLVALLTSVNIQTAAWSDDLMPHYQPGRRAYNNPNYPLHSAAAAGDLDKVRTLLANGADIDAVNGSETTVLALAIKQEQSDVARFLISQGADVNKESGRYESTALHAAAECNNLELTRLLLEAGADTNTQEYQSSKNAPKTPLDSLIFQGSSPEIARLLIAKMNFNSCYKNGENVGEDALARAIISKRPQVARMLIKANIPLNKDAAKHMPQFTPELIPLALFYNPKNFDSLEPYLAKSKKGLYALHNVSNIGALVTNQRRGIKPSIQPIDISLVTTAMPLSVTPTKPSTSLATWPKRSSGNVADSKVAINYDKDADNQT